MTKKIDARVLKTQGAIKTAFFELINEVGFSKISVTKIIKLAEINRSTFYAHYIDKFDLLEKAEEELLSELKQIADNAPLEKLFSLEQNAYTHAINSYFIIIVNYVYENGKMFALLLSDKGDPAFINKLSEMIKLIWIEKNLLDKLSIPPNYALAAIIGIMTNLITEWVKSGFKESPEDFRNIALKIVQDIPKNLLT